MKKHEHSFPGVYSLINTLNGKRYIGSSKNIRHRILKHFGSLRLKKHPNCFLQSDWDASNSNPYTYNVLEYCSIEILKDREQVWMDGLIPTYNIFKDSKSPKGSKQKPSSILKISQANKGKPSSRKGVKCLPSTIEKMRAANLGKRYSDEVNLKKGSKGEKNGSWGKGKPVSQYDMNCVFIRDFVNANQALNSIGRGKSGNSGNIQKCCDNKIKYAYGYKWKYKI